MVQFSLPYNKAGRASVLYRVSINYSPDNGFPQPIKQHKKLFVVWVVTWLPSCISTVQQQNGDRVGKSNGRTVVVGNQISSTCKETFPA
jgi:hypothetical protein